MRNNSSALRPREIVKSRENRAVDPSPLRGMGTMDHTIFLVVIILTLFGVMMVFSASYVITGRSAQFNFDSFYYLRRHGVMAVIGFLVLMISSNFNYHLLKKFALPMYLASLVLLILAWAVGHESHGAARWIDIFGFRFQPSEVSKAALIFVMAKIVSGNRRILDKWPGFLFCCGIVGVMSVFVLLGNLSTAIIIAIIGGGMIFVASPHMLRFIVVGAAGVSGMLGYLYYQAYLAEGMGFRGGRFRAWIDPFSDMQGFGFQIVQSLYAIASGGLFGLGIGQSRQKTFLPEVHNDVIFSVIAEELGFVGSGIILLLFGILIWRGLKIAMNAPDNFGALVAAGIVLMIASQVIINVAVVTNSIPNTGIPMPFISYGGTALVICMGLMGVLLNISRQTKLKE
ncbi:MAG: putative lipid II flippase FtsW [Defluviitaleaceae bacterium]|nr:putative lipid II flippase FtsW [Defluviitaleaceae bacterium]